MPLKYETFKRLSSLVQQNHAAEMRLRPQVVEAIHKLDEEQGLLWGSSCPSDDSFNRKLSKAEAGRIEEIDRERRRLVTFLLDTGGLPAGLSPLY